MSRDIFLITYKNISYDQINYEFIGIVHHEFLPQC